MDHVFIFLAQATDTNADEVFTRILVAFCSIGILWLALMGAMIYRGIENRRRNAQGLDPLPPFFPWLYQQVLRVVNPSALPESAKQLKTAAPKQATRAPTWDPDMPEPDLDMLMGEFGAPEFDALDFTSVPEPARAIPAHPAAPPPDADRDQAEEFSFDLDVPAPVLRAASESVPESVPVSEFDSEYDIDESDVDESDIDESYIASEAEADIEAGPESEFESTPEESAMSPSPASSAPSDAIELLRVWRDISDGSLILEINGQQFSSLSELRSADLERRFMNVLKDLVALAKSSSGAAPQPAQPRPQPVQAQPRPQSQPAQPRPVSKPAETSAEDEPPVRKLSTDEMPSMSPSAMFRQMGQIAMGRKPEIPEPDETPEPLSIPEQIDALLQTRLRSMPEYRGREIVVQPSLGGLVIIKVDGKFYEGVGEVEDDDVRALLQDVVREWENSQ